MQIESKAVNMTRLDVTAIEIVGDAITVRYNKGYDDPSIIAAQESYTVESSNAPGVKEIQAWAENAILPRAGAVKAKVE